MKKYFCCLLIVVLLTGCKKNTNITCTKNSNTRDETIILNVIEDVIKIKGTYKYKNQIFGLESMNNISEIQKQSFIDSMYTNLDFDSSTTYKDFNIDIKVEDRIVINFNGNIKKNEENINLKKIGINYFDTNLDNVMKYYESSGYKCS